MKVYRNYLQGHQKSEVYKTDDKIFYNGTIYKIPEGSFNAVIYKSETEIYPMIFFEENELRIIIFVDNLEDFEKADGEFEPIPEGYYETYPVIEVEPKMNEEA
jgi:hypothetical protein